jgi:hypothetical protein
MLSIIKNLILIAFIQSLAAFAQDEKLDSANLNESQELESLLKEVESPQSSSDEDFSALEATILTDENESLNQSQVDAKKSEDDVLASEVESEDLDKKVLNGPGLETVEPVGDELEALKADIKETDVVDPLNEESQKVKKTLQSESTDKNLIPQKLSTDGVVNSPDSVSVTSANFDVGREEKELLDVASRFQGQMSASEWNEVASQAQVSSYTVVKDDWLFKISRRLFGTGHYYAKIWALNPYITNPHLIEPGMILSFSTGNSLSMPEVKVGEFSDEELNKKPGEQANLLAAGADFEMWGEEAEPDWLRERKLLEAQGIYLQYATPDTLEDLAKASEIGLVKEYENYEPPQAEFELNSPRSNYDSTGIDKNSKIVFKFKEGFYLNTFLTNNPVQDFGHLEAGPERNTFFTDGDRGYVKFDEALNVLPGDRFSIYSPQGEVSHSNSDRKGFKYTITGQIRVLNRIKNQLWEIEIEKAIGAIQRGDRVTVYTPKIERILKTFNRRMIESGIVGAYSPNQSTASYGDVLYIDRGRADGVEMGNVFEVYGFRDRLTNKVIAEQPTYKTAELTVITLTDNFSTVLVTSSPKDIQIGDIAITKTREAALKASAFKKGQKQSAPDALVRKSLEELDVELKVEDLNDSLLEKADKIQLTEDELAELERQERERNLLKDSERDIRALERLEKEIEDAEKVLNEAKLDEDKILENQSLEEVERSKALDQQEALDEIEQNLGKRYMDQDLNTKDNPYGLTEFDVEEIDDLLNVDQKPKKATKSTKLAPLESIPLEKKNEGDSLAPIETPLENNETQQSVESAINQEEIGAQSSEANSQSMNSESSDLADPVDQDSPKEALQEMGEPEAPEP